MPIAHCCFYPPIPAQNVALQNLYMVMQAQSLSGTLLIPVAILEVRYTSKVVQCAPGKSLIFLLPIESNQLHQQLTRNVDACSHCFSCPAFLKQQTLHFCFPLTKAALPIQKH